MNRLPIRTLATAGCLVLSVACHRGPGRDDSNSTTEGRDPKGNAPGVVNRLSESATSGSSQTITLTGCLQRGDRNGFILTTVNEPNASVGTTDSAASGDTVRREQLRAARHAYALEPRQNVNLDDMVGKQVQVTGMVTERTDLPGATAGRTDDKGTSPISNSDLSRVGVTAVTMTAGACGANGK